MNVIIESKAVDHPEDYNVSEIIGQSPKAGETVPQGGTVTLYIPDIVDLYPDFTKGDYSLTEIQDFAKKYNLKLEIVNVKTNEYPAGTIISQNRNAGSKIAAGATFKVTIAQEEDEEVDEPTVYED